MARELGSEAGDACCTPADPCRRCELWERHAADHPVLELMPCIWCEDAWPPAALDPRTRLCPACRLEIVDRQVAEARVSGPPEGVEEARRRAQERRRAEHEAASRQLAEQGGPWSAEWSRSRRASEEAV